MNRETQSQGDNQGSVFDLSPKDIENKIHNGYMAGYIAAAINLILGAVRALASPMADINFIGYVVTSLIMAALAYGVYRKSRVSAIVMFVYFAVACINMLVIADKVIGALIPILFLLFFFQAIRGTFAWHRMHDHGGRHSGVYSS